MRIAPALFISLAVVASAALAQSYPTRPVTLVVPAEPGGPSDAVARMLADRLKDRLGQPVLVENRGGANGAIGVGAVARAPRDGYMVLLSVDGPITVNPALSASLPYDSTRDLQPVAVVGDGGEVVLAVQVESPAKSVPELVALMRKDPSQANYVSSGAGFPSHIVGELFKREARFEAQHIPVKGAGAAMKELLSGRMSFSFPPVSVALPQAKAGKIRLLAIPSAARSPLIPDVQTFGEAGLPKVVLPGYWIATYVPAGTPRPVVEQLAGEIRGIAGSQEFTALLARQALVPSLQTPDQIAARVRKELEIWRSTIRALDIRAE
jgi:tripartite-type tricarboxylate transporter receptor subunit TctC